MMWVGLTLIITVVVGYFSLADTPFYDVWNMDANVRLHAVVLHDCNLSSLLWMQL